ncbi:hypothetical protein [Photobacterium leiognathi]|uniref:hypothetical protein n=1 Tax=Photobacterium leiognathi TaxID=553611 RepID=UPI0029817D24|nr:hypothetical protein [Photobacterium leiognathi]
MKKLKIAVLIAGPARYVNSVIDNIERVKGNRDIDYFVFLWKAESRSKARKDEQILNRGKYDIKYLVEAEPNSETSYDNIFKKQSDSGLSSHFNIIGMFNSMRVLVQCLEIFNINYDYVVRMRTDCSIITEDFFPADKIEDGIALVSKNYLIPYSWVSDHIMIASVKTMIKVWSWKDNDYLHSEYNKVGRNPEKLLARKLKRNNINVIDKWVRYKDYHIVYFPVKESDPESFNSNIIDNGVESFFINAGKIYSRDRKLIDSYILNQKKNQDYYALPKVKKIKIKLKRFFDDNFRL